MIPVKAIPTGSPVLDSTAVWTPPVIGPSDSKHVFLAHALDGLTSAQIVWPDMVGGLTPTAYTAAMRFDAASKTVKLTGGIETPIGAAAGSISAEMTCLVVAQTPTPGISAQVQVPGYAVTTGGRVAVTSNIVARFSGINSPNSDLAVYVVRVKAGSADAWINGASAGASIAGLKPSASTRVSIGSSGGYVAGSYDERFGLVKYWQRALSDDEVLAAVADAKRLFKIA